MQNNKPIPIQQKFSCTLQRGNLSLEVSAEFNIIVSRQHFADNKQAIKTAQISAQQMMRKGWKLVELNGKKVKQGKIILARSPSLISKIEHTHPLPSNTRLPLGNGTVGRQE